MPLPPRLFPGDVELGKRDDDHRPGTKITNPLGLGLGLLWEPRRLPHAPHRRSIRRFALGVLALIALYYFFNNIPTDLGPPRKRPYYNPPDSGPTPALPTGLKTSSAEPPHKHKQEQEEDGVEILRRNFNGPIKFYKLASSLRAAPTARPADLYNRDILFAAASLKSAAILLPIACDMAMRKRNFVHFALMGRDPISIDILKSVNGISEDCGILFHDARPDFSTTSTDFRMEVSSSAAFNHINNFVKPNAALVDGSGGEEPFFLKGIKARALALQKTVIELPENAEQNLMWITLLDSSSLSAWNMASIDIAVHAQPSASGSLMRLLDSLTRADFFSSAPPRLTIELPNQIDEPTKEYLARFKWPPNRVDNSGSLLTLHHRISQHKATAEENSIRFLETFWPADPWTSHVLVLSPQAELSPLFFHYLKYTLLEHRYSNDNPALHYNMMGISLDLPSTYLNDSSAFTPPATNTSDVTPFLWQAPNSNAALYFGDKWVELHDFVARLLTSQHNLPTPPTLNEKLVSKTYPSWLEHVLKLIRARGYWLLYPGLEKTDSLVTLHNDLYLPPDEYREDVEMGAESDQGELTADPDRHLSLKHTETPLITKPLLTLLPFSGSLPKVAGMPLLSWDGERIDAGDIGNHAASYSVLFREEIGGCDASAALEPVLGLTAEDLFCLDSAPAEG
ncbi:Uncharacterized protein BP5553_10339 [Venustampulla echinocandica]|uniref:Glycosyltransferase 2 n=1 Tax=Venustampulla echinocandica TaxID=2656787 RepID=A0A370TA02_9HELO|nr:Uncharacterized protein BP5553_10339 [Venustampulla echinocandica]RDL30461.1 Uncharacterized protein BP5553_10339 [Venustampulla echinocandica]